MHNHAYPVVARVHERWTQLARLFCAASEQASSWSRASEDLLLEQLASHTPRRVLDLACGVGDPALRIARDYPTARVTALDFVEPMLGELERRARAARLTNLHPCHGDMLALPFEAGSFDTVTARFGIQYYDDAIKARALAEAARVLQSGGRLVIVDWGVEGHGALKAFYMDVLSQYPQTAHANDAATAFALLDNHAFAALVREAGFRDVRHEYAQVHWHWRGSRGSLWEVVVALAPQLTELMASLPPSLATEINQRILAGLERYETSAGVVMPVRHVVITGVRS